MLWDSPALARCRHIKPVCSTWDFLETFLIPQSLFPLIILSIIQHDRGPQKDLFIFPQDLYFMPTSYITSLYRNVMYCMSVR
jgi:hypothetical protein